MPTVNGPVQCGLVVLQLKIDRFVTTREHSFDNVPPLLLLVWGTVIGRTQNQFDI